MFAAARWPTTADRPRVQVHRRPQHPGRLRGRDGHAPALHDRHGARRRRGRRRGLRAARARLRARPDLREAPSRAGRPSGRSTTSRTTTTSRGHHDHAGIGEAGKTTVYVRKRNPQIDTDKPDQYNQYIAISTRCMHLGCPVRCVEAAERFICPCHGGVYDFPGKVAGGPPVRPLDRFYTARARRQRARDRPALHRQLASSSASRRATRASRSTASASTSTRRGPPIRKLPGT